MSDAVIRKLAAAARRDVDRHIDERAADLCKRLGWPRDTARRLRATESRRQFRAALRALERNLQRLGRLFGGRS